MKRLCKLLALLTALCLLAGCGPAAEDPAAQPEGSETLSAPTASDSAQTDAQSTEAEAPAQTDAPTESLPEDAAASETIPEAEPEGWEEDWPQEYPLDGYVLIDGAIAQTGSLNVYRYQQLPGAENYMNLAADYVRQALDCGDALTMQEDSPHDGYANWFMQAPNGNASISGSSITGRFCFSLYPGFDRVLEMSETAITDPGALEQAARDFVGRFSDITGELVLLQTRENPQSYHDERREGMYDITVPALAFTFCSAEHSRLELPVQEGLMAPVLCGDSNIEDLRVHCFTVTVWPDGTVVWGDNYITRAEAVPDGTVAMLDESNLSELTSYVTSLTEHDTLVIEEIRADAFSVYFGHALIEPLLTMRYHLASNPDEHLSTDFVMGLF